MSNAPVFNINLADFWADPYPALAKIRAVGPLVYVPQFDRTMIVKRDEIVNAEPKIEVFSSEQPEGLMNRLLGQNVMRRDGEAHRLERKALNPCIQPTSPARTISNCSEWISKAMVADVALPMLFDAMPDLRLTDDVRVGGWAFRGVLNLPCAW